MALYGLLRASAQRAILERTGAAGVDFPLDPLLFAGAVLALDVAPAVRAVFPYLARIVSSFGRRIWSPARYGALVRLGRGGGERTSVSSASLPTVNAAVEDRIRYRVVPDLVISRDGAESPLPPPVVPPATATWSRTCSATPQSTALRGSPACCGAPE